VKYPRAPLQLYNDAVQAGRLAPDDGQLEAITILQGLYQQIKHQNQKYQRLWARFVNQKQQIQGVYLYGGVGRGKTMLMDMFAESLQNSPIQRLHFHDFMIHAQNLIADACREGRKMPVMKAAKQLLAKGHIICFDEMEIRDIADAMIIKRLFTALWQQGMILVTTSNRAPDELYLGGLNRFRFLPFIDALKKQMVIHKISDGPDWRMQLLKTISSWYILPQDKQACRRLDEKLNQIFNRLSVPCTISSENIKLGSRTLRLDKVAANIADIEFAAICGVPLGIRDYLVVADRFAGLVIRNIPALDDNQHNEVRRLIWLVDALYDRGRFLIASSAVAQDKLYQGERWGFEFTRTCSRLSEMARLRGMAG